MNTTVHSTTETVLCDGCGKPLTDREVAAGLFTHGTQKCQQSSREYQVQDKTNKMLIDHEARERAKAQISEREAQARTFTDFTTVQVMLDEHSGPESVRFQGLHSIGGRFLTTAARKAGKTTMGVNRIRSLLTGEPFLGCVPVVNPVREGSVAVLNYEMGAGRYAEWLHKAGLTEFSNQGRLFVMNLRGHGNPLAVEYMRERLAQKLDEINARVVIVDTFGRSFFQGSQQDATDVNHYLHVLDTVVGPDRDLFLEAHAGKEQGRGTRGSSAIEDWGDTILYLDNDAAYSSGSGLRSVYAMGRDVDDLWEENEWPLLMDDDGITLTVNTQGPTVTQLKAQRKEQAKWEKEEQTRRQERREKNQRFDQILTALAQSPGGVVESKADLQRLAEERGYEKGKTTFHADVKDLCGWGYVTTDDSRSNNGKTHTITQAGREWLEMDIKPNAPHLHATQGDEVA